MRVNRAKLVRKYLRFFRLVYNIKPSYSILLDGNFIYHALKNNINISDRLTKILQGESFKLYILQSAVNELQLIGSKGETSFQFATKQCIIVNDNDINGETPFEKLIGYINKLESNAMTKKRYFICTQDRDLRNVIGNIPGYPLFYWNQVTLVMESPSQMSKDYNIQIEENKEKLTEQETEILAKIGAKESNTVTEKTNMERRKRKATQANPLSNLKPSEDSNRSKKRKLNAKFRHKS